jgi:tetratricopeptide (TPR) repeat protein
MRADHMPLPRHFTIAFVLLTATWQVMAQTNTPSDSTNFAFRISLSAGITNVFVQRKGATARDDHAFNEQKLYVGDRLQTRANGRVVLISPNGTTLRIGEFADLEIQTEPNSSSGLSLMVRRARLYFFHRGDPTDFKVRTRTTSAAVRGTEFDFEADEDGITQITVLDGEVALSNEISEVLVRNGEQASAVPGRAPTNTAVIKAVNIIQWCLYYPAILDLEDLRFEPETLGALKVSLAHYRDGDLLGALAAYPAARHPISVAETIYRSALLLSVGSVQESETLLTNLVKSTSTPEEADRDRRLIDAIRLLIASVKRQPHQSKNVPELATEWLAESYYLQSQADLQSALKAARQATIRSPRFGFAWERVAELEFSFARTAAATEALQKALELSPRNAQALALRGFTFAARNDLGSAVASFDEALAVDNALGNAWLGRGLCRIRRGDVKRGVEDLQTAVVVEPQRAVLRSYLGKGFAVLQEDALAGHELELAKRSDPGDPTAWLYSALLNQENNRINQGIQDLEKSQALNDNRAIFRSGLLLDQDRAVRGANLASIYADAGMADVSVREAAKAVSYDYAN